MDSTDSKKARVIDIGLRSDLTEKRTVREIQSAWKSSDDDYVKDDMTVIRNPFPVCVVKNFVRDPTLLKLSVAELNDVTFDEKSNDLYQFRQSDDLKNLTGFSFIPQLYDLIKGEGRMWVGSILDEFKLKKDISATFSSYTYLDRLLCHDDKCEDRHVAFILYLMEDWQESDGGCLQLFDTDSKGLPNKVVKSISPQFNMMVFFEVSQFSYHQVSEVLSDSKNRLSLNGWFHTGEKLWERPKFDVAENPKTLASKNVYNLKQYFAQKYINKDNMNDIKILFSNQSEIQLDKFLSEKFYEEVCEGLKSENMTWEKLGPANLRNYEVADLTSLPASLQTLKDIFESESWFRYLTNITDLDFVPSDRIRDWEMGSLPFCHFEIQKWTHACYTLIQDKDPEYQSDALDVVLRFPFPNVQYYNGDVASPEAGHIIYVDPTMQTPDCLLHIGYEMNSLGLVYREEGTLRFTKYIHSEAEPFYLIICTYREWKSNLEEEILSSDGLSLTDFFKL